MEKTKKISHRLAYLYCGGCSAESSATPGDYWDAPADLRFDCCGLPMLLCVRGDRFDGDQTRSHSVTVGDLRNHVTNVGEEV